MTRKSLDVDRGWRLRDFAVGEMRPLDVAAAGLDDRFWMTASVPGDVFSTLIEHKVIEHPFFGHNDQKSRWVEEREWWYRTAFELSAADTGIAEGIRWELTLEGLDTFATVFVNGLEIGSSRNMFCAAVFDVGRILVPGKNVIAVKFDPVSQYNKDKLLFEWSSYTKDRPWLRKTAMHFGWDWGPRIVSVGICGKVRLERYRHAKLRGVYCRTEWIGEKEAPNAAGETPKPGMAHDSPGDRARPAAQTRAAEETRPARLRIDLDVETFAIPQRRGAIPGKRIEALLRLVDDTGTELAFSKTDLPDGHGAVILELSAARLWWTHDLGEPHLYRLETALLTDGEETDRRSEDIGVRTLALSLERDGRADFCFVLNGVRVFAKGANWIPVDHFFGAAPDERYGRLLAMSAEAGMNAIRVWGGGIYEKDVFYRECDRRGLLVWQDCAFANALFPDFNRDFMESVRGEIEYNVTRLRNHASLALWCGNNEIDWLYDMKTAGGDIKGAFYGEAIYHDLIPRVLAALDPDRAYWPSSPWGRGGDQDVNDPGYGDRHNWQVWHGSVYPRKFAEPPVLDYSVAGVSFKNYARDFTLFSSEFGMHASANRYTLEKWIPPGALYWGGAELAYRNKDTNHRKGILLMEGFTGVPANVREYMAYSMLTQAEGLKFGIEHYRRNRGGAAGGDGSATSGALIWQLNDSWPGTSWSLIDYELLPKASYYYARKFFAPLLLSLELSFGDSGGQDGDRAAKAATGDRALRLWCVNDRGFGQNGKASVELLRFDGQPVYRADFAVSVRACEAIMVAELDQIQVLNGRDPAEVFVRLGFVPDPGQTGSGPGGPPRSFDSYESINYLRDHKDLRLPQTRLAVTADPETRTVTVTALDALARMVEIDLDGMALSDNFFDLPAGESKTVRVSGRVGDRAANPATRDGAADADAWKTRFARLRVNAINQKT